MLFKRQKTLLALLDALEGKVGHLDFQKLLLLYCLEWEQEPSYDFVPYRFGGFSFTSYADIRRLTERGLMADDGHRWTIREKGREVVADFGRVRAKAITFARDHEGMRGDGLIAEAYRRHPYYATRSEMAEGVLAADHAALAEIEAQRPNPGAPGVCTIGYEGRSLENYFNILLRAGITLLCDVRANALSRKYGFSKGTLETSCEGVGIGYQHMPELGISTRERRGLETREDYNALFAVYESEFLPKQAEPLTFIQRWVREGHCVALTCFERLPEQCHRHCVADALERMFGPAFAPRHL